MPTKNSNIYQVSLSLTWFILNKLENHRLWGEIETPIIHIDLDDYFEIDHDLIFQSLMDICDKLNEGIMTEEMAISKVKRDEYDDKQLQFCNIESIYNDFNYWIIRT
jgi:hypothetical protein